MALAGKVAIVTGASRGIGKGIALQLGAAGATVYITGRTTQKQPGAPVPGSLQETAQEVEARGGKCIPVPCDHTKDVDIDNLFSQVTREQDGRLDILVNNAYSAVNTLMANGGKPFWQLPATLWDEVNDVGLRNHYICAVKAAQLMVPRKNGLIVNVSSIGGIMYLFGPAYGVGKAAKDRMAADCGHELKRHNVTFISLWPGAVQTEIVQELMIKPLQESKGQSKPKSQKAQMVDRWFINGETTEFPGKCIVALAQDPNLIKKTARIHTTADLGEEYGLRDIDGRQYASDRSLKNGLQVMGWKKTADYVPALLKVPRFVMNIVFGRL